MIHDHHCVKLTCRDYDRSASVRSVAIQCDLLAVPPLQELVREQNIPSDSKAESVASGPEDTDLHSSFQIIQDDTTIK